MSTPINERRRARLEADFPGGDWFTAGQWRETPLFARAPALIERAMRALAALAEPAWFTAQVLADTAAPRHQLAVALMDTGYVGNWPAIATGLHLEAVGSIPEKLRQRLLDPAEFPGAASELGAAAALRMHGLTFDWFPTEGGEFFIHGDPIRYVEVKRPQYSSERAEAEVSNLSRLWQSVGAAFHGFRVSCHLRPDLMDGLSTRQRADFDWNQLERQIVEALEHLRDAGQVPARQELSIGTIWIARSQDELHKLGGGGYGGFYIDERHETDRVVRNAINRAIRQLPRGQPSVLALDWGAATVGFGDVVARRLGHLRDSQPALAGVIVRRAAFSPRDIVPEHGCWVIGNPNLIDLLRSSPAAAALAADRYAALRDPERHGTP